MFKKILTPIASLRMTVVLLAFSMLTIFVGTLAQRHYNINVVERKYFHTFVAWMDFKDLSTQTDPARQIGGTLPIPGGYLLGVLLLTNLVAAHTIRFKLQWKRTGIILIHASLILLLVGEAIRATKSVESRMIIDEGGYANFSFSLQRQELALIEPGSEGDNVIVVPGKKLIESFKQGTTISDPNLPVQVKVDYYADNSDIVSAAKAGSDTKSIGTAGDFKDYAIQSRPKAIGLKSGVDMPSAFVTFYNGQNHLGTYLVSTHSERKQELRVGDKTYEVVFRFERHYKPFRIRLDDFKFDRYPGTETPLNFSSDVQLIDPEQNEDRPVRIWMNHPLRHRGETFFQADWNKETERGTVLQVVRNPGWVIPYVACIIGGVGLLLHFGIVLVNFIRKDAKLPASAPKGAATVAARGGNARASRPTEYTLDARPGWMKPSLWVALGTVVVFALYVGSKMRPAEYKDTPYDLETFGKLVISYHGRIQPLDSVARNMLLVSNGRDYFEDEKEQKQPAIRMLLEAFANDPKLEERRVFKIDLAELHDLLKIDPRQKRYALKDILPNDDAYQSLRRQVALAAGVESDARNIYQKTVLELWGEVNSLMAFRVLEPLYLVAPEKPGDKWMTVGEGAQKYRETGNMPRSLKAIVDLREAYAKGNAAEFNKQARLYYAFQQSSIPKDATRTSFERWTNQFKPDLLSAVLYVFVFVLAAASWLAFRETMQRTAFWLLGFTVLLHTFAIVARIYISQRPPVTNLENSAVFIGWGAALLALGVEFFYRNGISAAVGAAIGANTIAIYLTLVQDKGDSMAVLQAVLDTNFWLATHVVCITLGYSATFLAGVMGVVWIGGGLTGLLDRDNAKGLTRMIYGVTCFAMLFSFIGTVLGGIWADQSWGRFWGWDPKENGAILVVLCNALLLHARWGGLAQGRGIAALAVFGNIVTSWSWFGTNMLGVGLHAYGFIPAAFYTLIAFMGVNVVLIGLSAIPLHLWPSFRNPTAAGGGGFPVKV